MLAPDSLTVAEKIPSIFFSRKNSRTNASVSRDAVPLPMAMALTLCVRSSASSFGAASALPCFEVCR